MKFSPCLIAAAFVGSNKRNNRNAESSFQSNRVVVVGGGTVIPPSSTALPLLPFSTPVTEDLQPPTTIMMSITSTTTTTRTTSRTSSFQQQEQQHQSFYRPLHSSMETGVWSWIQNNLLVPEENAATTAAASASPPTKEEIAMLRQAFAAFYGVDRNLEQAEQLFSQAIESWQRQAPDERAGLYRVRGDVYMALLRPNDAITDYSESIKLLEQGGPSSGGELADPEELPASYLGRARAIRSLGVTNTNNKATAERGAKDYQMALRLSSREEWDTTAEMEEDGAMRNPYAAWEWGMALRRAGDYNEAARVHTMASDFFEAIADRPRSVIAGLDAGIDSAAAAAATATANGGKNANGQDQAAQSILIKAIARTTTVEGRDIPLLQRVIAKEGEGRMALATLMWNAGQRADAEAQRGEACARLDQLEADALARKARGGGDLTIPPPRLKFNIDDATVGAFDISCARFKNSVFVTERLEWPIVLQSKLEKLNSLGK